MRILLVEDEKISRISLTKTLAKQGDEVVACETGSEGLARLAQDDFEVVITDLRLPGADGMEILRAAKERDGECVVIMVTAFATVENAVEALKLGAYDYLTKPFSPEKLLHMLDKIRKLRELVSENTWLRRRVESFEDRVILGDSPPIRRLRETIRVVAPRNCTVLVHGESGTGKELVARALHLHSPRRERPFVAFNCAAIPETLLESELFGHERGAFSGAVSRHIGYFERANHGTVFMDDVDDFPFPLQVKLLRLLQERELTRVGGQKTFAVDIRVICATKADLWELVQQNRFRSDLYFRLNIVPVRVPPLRERKEDLLPLADHFLRKYGADETVKARLTELTGEMMRYDWAGNVRELENVVQRIIALPEGEQFDFGWQRDPECAPGRLTPSSKPRTTLPYQETMERTDREIIRLALQRSAFNISRAAKMLDIPRSTLRSKLEKYGIAAEG
jgi:DNA-binding NtrC family response regulator